MTTEKKPEVVIWLRAYSPIRGDQMRYVVAQAMGVDAEKETIRGIGSEYGGWTYDPKAPYLDGLQLRGHIGNERWNVGGLIGFSQGVYDIHCIDRASTAARIARTLSRVARAIAAAQPLAVPAMQLAPFARAVGAKRCVVEREPNASGYLDCGKYRFVSIAEGTKALHELIEAEACAAKARYIRQHGALPAEETV